MTFNPKLASLLFAVGLLFSACSQDSTEETAEDMTNVPFTRDVSLDTCLIVISHSTDFCDWKKAFETTSNLRLDHGIETFEIFQGREDTNLTFSLSKIENLKIADDFLNSDDLSSILDDVSDPDATKLLFLDQQLEYTLDANDSLLMYMSFKTLSYSRWEKAFLDDYRKDPNREFEVVRVFRGIEEPNQVHMIFKVNDPQYVEKAEKNNAFKMKMLAAGVVSYPVTYKLRGLGT